jgi:hypothetical protein
MLQPRKVRPDQVGLQFDIERYFAILQPFRRRVERREAELSVESIESNRAQFDVASPCCSFGPLRQLHPFIHLLTPTNSDAFRRRKAARKDMCFARCCLFACYRALLAAHQWRVELGDDDAGGMNGVGKRQVERVVETEGDW